MSDKVCTNLEFRDGFVTVKLSMNLQINPFTVKQVNIVHVMNVKNFGPHHLQKRI